MKIQKKGLKKCFSACEDVTNAVNKQMMENKQSTFCANFKDV